VVKRGRGKRSNSIAGTGGGFAASGRLLRKKSPSKRVKGPKLKEAPTKSSFPTKGVRYAVLPERGNAGPKKPSKTGREKNCAKKNYRPSQQHRNSDR